MDTESKETIETIKKEEDSKPSDKPTESKPKLENSEENKNTSTNKL